MSLSKGTSQLTIVGLSLAMIVTLCGSGGIARAQDYATGFEAADGWVPGFVCGSAEHSAPGPRAVAITPDLVNGGSYGDVFIAPDPFISAYNAAEEEDLNGNFRLDQSEVDINGNEKLDTFRDPFIEWTNAEVSTNIQLEYIDDWDLYHVNAGEVHCSSNEKRQISADRWWEFPQ